MREGHQFPLNHRLLPGHVPCHFKLAGIDVGEKKLDDALRGVAKMAAAVGAGQRPPSSVPDALVTLRVHAIVEWWLRMVINTLVGSSDPTQPFMCDEGASALILELSTASCESLLHRMNRPLRYRAFEEAGETNERDALEYYEAAANCPLDPSMCQEKGKPT